MKYNEIKELTEILINHTDGAFTKLSAKEEIYLKFLKEFKSESQFISEYFQDNTNNYQVFKTRFTKLLVLSFYNSNFKANYYKTEYQKELIFVEKAYALANSLLYSGSRQIGLFLFEKVLSKAVKLEHYHIQVQVLNEIIEQYSLIKPIAPKRLLSLQNQYKIAFNNLTLYQKARHIYIELGKESVKTKSNQTSTKITKYKNTVDNLLTEVESVDSYYIKYYSYNSAFFYYNLCNNYVKLKLICERAMAYFEKKKDFPARGIFSFTQKLALVHLSKMNYVEAKSLLIKCTKYIPKENINIKCYPLGYLFNLHIYQKNYNQALVILHELISHKNFKHIPITFIEPWYLKEAFIHFLIRTRKINLKDHPDIQLRPFRIHRFLNEVPVFSKDKKGVNITINIIQVLFLIADKKYEKATDKLNSLKQYSYRYLRKKEFVRPRSFISMLLTLPTAHFNARFVNERSRRHLQTLKENPMDYSEKSINIEIIPYEQLWEEVLSLL